jgi:hypothetical protein
LVSSKDEGVKRLFSGYAAGSTTWSKVILDSNLIAMITAQSKAAAEHSEKSTGTRICLKLRTWQHVHFSVKRGSPGRLGAGARSGLTEDFVLIMKGIFQDLAGHLAASNPFNCAEPKSYF